MTPELQHSLAGLVDMLGWAVFFLLIWFFFFRD